MPLFSIIIPTCNRSALLGEALDSVFAQSCTDYETIVVDDGSTDGTETVIRDYGERIRSLRQPNRGPGAARNLGLRQAVGEYVAFLDSDDVWFPWTLASYRQAILEHGNPSFICGDCMRFYQAAELKTVPNRKLAHEVFGDYYSAWRRVAWIGICGVAIRREALLQCGGFTDEPINAEDSDLWMKLGTAPGFVWITTPVVFGYRRNPLGVSTEGGKTIQGIRQMVLNERNGKYPGGRGRRRDRWQILTRHVRSISLGCVADGKWREAWWFYRNTFWWHVSLGRIRYLLAMPLLCLLGGLKGCR